MGSTYLYYYLFIAILLFATPIFLMGQVRMEYMGNSTWRGSYDDLFIIETHNLGSSAYRTYLNVALKNSEGETVFTTQSQDFQLPPGRHVFNLGEITRRENTPLPDLEEGIYLFCINLFRTQDQQMAANTCRNLNVDFSDQKDAPESVKDIEFSGRMRIYGQLSNRISLFEDFAPNNLNAEIEPQVRIKGLPFSGRIFLSTQANSLRYDLNTAGLHFDVNQFRQMMTQKLQAKLSEYKKHLKEGLPVDADFEQSLAKLKTQEIQRITQKLKGKIPPNLDEKIMEARKAWNEYERVDEILSLDVFDKVEKEWQTWAKEEGFDPEMDHVAIRDSVCERKPKICEKQMQLMAKKEELEKLKARKKELEVWKSKYQKLRKYAQDLEQLRALESGDLEALMRHPDVLEKIPLISKGQKLLTSIQKVGVGTVFPYFSPLTLDGISLQGWDVELQSGKLYLASSGGKLGRSAFSGFSDSIQNRKGNLFASKVGYGKTDDTHLYTTWMIGNWEEEESGGRQGQLLVGLEGQLQLFQDRLQLTGEWVRSMEDLRGEASADAWSVHSNLQLFEGKTRFMGSYEKLMPGYFSIGAPLLLRETERYNVEVQQSLLDNSLEVRAYLRQNSNQLLPYSFQSASIKSAGLSLRYQAKKLPYVQLDYAPYSQNFGLSDTLEPQPEQGGGNGVLTAQLGYVYNLGSWQLQSTFSYSRQFGTQAAENTVFSSSLLNWNQLIQFDKYWGLNASSSYIHSQYAEEWDKTWTTDLSAFMRLKSGLYSSLGINYLSEQGEKGLLRKGIFLDNTLPIAKSIQAQLRLEYSHNENYRPDIPYYREYLLRGGISYTW